MSLVSLRNDHSNRSERVLLLPSKLNSEPVEGRVGNSCAAHVWCDVKYPAVSGRNILHHRRRLKTGLAKISNDISIFFQSVSAGKMKKVELC
mgnify:CR=1 FL=1